MVTGYCVNVLRMNQENLYSSIRNSAVCKKLSWEWSDSQDQSHLPDRESDVRDGVSALVSGRHRFGHSCKDSRTTEGPEWQRGAKGHGKPGPACSCKGEGKGRGDEATKRENEGERGAVLKTCFFLFTVCTAGPLGHSRWRTRPRCCHRSSQGQS